MGEAPELGDHIPVPDGEVGRSGVNELPEQRQGCLLHRQTRAGGELIEQQHQRQPALGGFAPAAQLAGDGLAGEAQESLPQQRISCR